MSAGEGAARDEGVGGEMEGGGRGGGGRRGGAVCEDRGHESGDGGGGERIGEDRVAGVEGNFGPAAWSMRRRRESVLSGDLKEGGMGEERTMESEYQFLSERITEPVSFCAVGERDIFQGGEAALYGECWVRFVNVAAYLYIYVNAFS